MTGVWERMVRLVRSILISPTRGRNLSDDQLHAFLLAAESVLNFQLLLPLVLDIDEQNPLTPNHLLKLNPTQALPPVLTLQQDVCLFKHSKYASSLFVLASNSLYDVKMLSGTINTVSRYHRSPHDDFTGQHQNLNKDCISASLTPISKLFLFFFPAHQVFELSSFFLFKN